MGLGKTITCVSLIAATVDSARAFAATPLDSLPEKPRVEPDVPDIDQFAGSVWGMPDVSESSTSNAKQKAKLQRQQGRQEALYMRACRVKAKSRATLIICPLSTVANWEDQFKEHWKGDVVVVGGAGTNCLGPQGSSNLISSTQQDVASSGASVNSSASSSYDPHALRVYIYHGNARRPDPVFLADFDVVVTTFSTLASEYSKQNRVMSPDEDEEQAGGSDPGGVDIDEHGNAVLRLPKKRAGVKRKKCTGWETSSALQSVHWFRVVLDEAQ